MLHLSSDELTQLLGGIGYQLALIPTEELEAHVRECRNSINRADNLGPILDPTGWMRSRHSGEFQDAKNQLAIAEALLVARKAIDQREGYIASLKKDKGGG